MTATSEEPLHSGDAALLEFLQRSRLLDEAQVRVVKSKSMQDRSAIDVAAVQLKFFTEDQLIKALTQECWVPHLKIGRYEIRQKALNTISRDHAIHFGIFPVDRLGKLLTLAMVNPLDADAVRILESKTGLQIKKVVAKRSEIIQAIDKYYRSP